jgi:hypothetical protein
MPATCSASRFPRGWFAIIVCIARLCAVNAKSTSPASHAFQSSLFERGRINWLAFDFDADILNFDTHGPEMWSSEQPVPKCAAAGTIDNPTEGISDGVCLEIYQAWGWPYDSGLLQRHNLDQAIGEARHTATPIPPGDDIGVATGAHGVYI